MYICEYVYVCIYIHTYTYIHTYIHTYITLPYLTLPYLTLPYLTLPYFTLPYLTLHYLTLHYITLHYITYIHTYTHIHIHRVYVCMCKYVCVCIYIYIYIYEDAPSATDYDDEGAIYEYSGSCVHAEVFRISHSAIMVVRRVGIIIGLGEYISMPPPNQQNKYDTAGACAAGRYLLGGGAASLRRRTSTGKGGRRFESRRDPLSLDRSGADSRETCPPYPSSGHPESSPGPRGGTPRSGDRVLYNQTAQALVPWLSAEALRRIEPGVKALKS